MMNQSTNKGVTPKRYDWSNGSDNPYTVEPPHGLIPHCLHCGSHSIVTLDGTDYFNYFVKGGRIADCFPYLTLDQREVLITGTHPECWDELFKEEE